MIGTGVPVACAAKIAYPKDQVFLFTGDGSFGFNGMEYDTAVRHDLPFVGIMGNDGVWGIDYHIQMGLYQRPVATELRQSRYDQVVQALGGHGELVRHPVELESAVKRALGSGLPSLINVTTKPAISALAAASILRNKASS
jgi:acetolactate synthase-1/2/3 large subunit